MKTSWGAAPPPAQEPALKTPTPRKRPRRSPPPEASPAGWLEPLEALEADVLPAFGLFCAAAAAAASGDLDALSTSAGSPPGSPRRAASPLPDADSPPGTPVAAPASGPPVVPGAPSRHRAPAPPEPEPPSLALLAGEPADCFMLPRMPTARRLFGGEPPEDEGAQQAQHAVDDFLAAMAHEQTHVQFAQAWGFDIKQGQPLPSHPRFAGEAPGCC